MNRPWLHERRRLTRKVRQKHGDRAIQWIGGVLYFAETLTPVPGIPEVPKSDRIAVG